MSRSCAVVSALISAASSSHGGIEILRSTKETLQHLHEETAQHPDLADRASTEIDRGVELRARDRQRKLIAKIDAALARLDDGTYGYCEETGEPINLMRTRRTAGRNLER